VLPPNSEERWAGRDVYAILTIEGGRWKSGLWWLEVVACVKQWRARQAVGWYGAMRCGGMGWSGDAS